MRSKKKKIKIKNAIELGVKIGCGVGAAAITKGFVSAFFESGKGGPLNTGVKAVTTLVIGGMLTKAMNSHVDGYLNSYEIEVTKKDETEEKEELSEE